MKKKKHTIKINACGCNHFLFFKNKSMCYLSHFHSYVRIFNLVFRKKKLKIRPEIVRTGHVAFKIRHGIYTIEVLRLSIKVWNRYFSWKYSSHSKFTSLSRSIWSIFLLSLYHTSIFNEASLAHTHLYKYFNNCSKHIIYIME